MMQPSFSPRRTFPFLYPPPPHPFLGPPLFIFSSRYAGFYKSDDLSRTVNPFIVTTSVAGTTFVDSFEGVNTAGTDLGVAEEFTFPTGSSGQYVRIQGELEPTQWLSINEVRKLT